MTDKKNLTPILRAAIVTTSIFISLLSFQPAGLAKYFYGEVKKVDSKEDIIMIRPIAYDTKAGSEVKIGYDDDTEFLVVDSFADIEKGDQISVIAEGGPSEGGVWYADTIRRMYYKGR